MQRVPNKTKRNRNKRKTKDLNSEHNSNEYASVA